MARKAREKSGTGIYAVILKSGYDIFGEKEMSGIFCDMAKKYLDDGLMGIRLTKNRADMLIKESDAGISNDMKPLIISFARTYNRTHSIEGKVFNDRFKSVPVETEELKRECLKYLDGGKIVPPYTNIGVAAPSPKPKKAAKKPETPQEEPKPKKQKNLPTWLL